MVLSACTVAFVNVDLASVPQTYVVCICSEACALWDEEVKGQQWIEHLQ